MHAVRVARSLGVDALLEVSDAASLFDVLVLERGMQAVHSWFALLAAAGTATAAASVVAGGVSSNTLATSSSEPPSPPLGTGIGAPPSSGTLGAVVQPSAGALSVAPPGHMSLSVFARVIANDVAPLGEDSVNLLFRVLDYSDAGRIDADPFYLGILLVCARHAARRTALVYLHARPLFALAGGERSESSILRTRQLLAFLGAPEFALGLWCKSLGVSTASWDFDRFVLLCFAVSRALDAEQSSGAPAPDAAWARLFGLASGLPAFDWSQREVDLVLADPQALDEGAAVATARKSRSVFLQAQQSTRSAADESGGPAASATPAVGSAARYADDDAGVGADRAADTQARCALL